MSTAIDMNPAPELQRLDPLTMPLQGLQVIEASAGTGKTWTVAALYVRLVLGHTEAGLNPERALFPPQILVMTFTDAATAELRGRVRERLAQAARCFADTEAGRAEADAFLLSLREQVPEAEWPACAARLDIAAQWMDDAAIFTIHGWSSRMLRQHAFDSASLFEQQRVEDGDALRLAAAQDYWRRWCYPLALSQIGAIAPLGGTPQALLERLQPLWSLAERAPGQAPYAGPEPDALVARWAEWQARREPLEARARAGWTPELVQAVSDAAAAKQLKNYRPDWLAGWLAQMAAWVQGESIKLEVLERFALPRLMDKGWAQAEAHAALADIDALCGHLQAEPDIGPDWLAHAAREIGAAYQAAKAQQAQFDFSDLLQRLYHALQAPDGRLAAAIRQQFPVALVDEFQDTDPWQYGALARIYQGPEARALGTGLVMIGDPKQAIYSFRGADLATYLQARAQAQAIHTLSGNFRSTRGVVAAVNHIFSRLQAPFGAVPFDCVEARNPQVQPLQCGGQAQPALTVWWQQRAEPATKSALLSDMAALFASQMVRLLQQGVAQPGDMAVLVRSGHEAQAIRAELARRGVRSVYLSDRDSVYATPEAHELWRILRAVAQPRSVSAVKAALLTRLWGLSWSALEALLHDEDAWDALIDQLHAWQKVWQQQGVLPLLHRCLHELQVPRRLMDPALAEASPEGPQGERRLTNLLHLGDLLQQASQGLQGEGALIRHLEAQLRDPRASGEAAQTRLESDAHLVQVVTMHKSKGLQYPLVFLPFAAGFREDKQGDDEDDALRLAEDVRLLYVALTRAEQALWLGVTPVKGDLDGKSPRLRSALSRLLGRQGPDDLGPALQAWGLCPDIAVLPAPAPDAQAYTPPAAEPARQPALQARRALRSGWWTASFSALTRELVPLSAESAVPPSEREARLEDAQADSLPLLSPELAAADSGQAALPGAWDDFPAGSRYGTLLHDLLEWQAQRGWPIAQAGEEGAQAAEVEREWAALLARQALALKLDDTQAAALAPWVQQLARAELHWPGNAKPLVLGALAPAQYWAEMAFSLPVRSLSAQALDALISAQVLPGQPRPALQPRQLEGMLTGFMDLVLEHQGRYHVLDYKSNRLPDYAPATLAQAVLAHRYDVQYCLYLLALHRLLKWRLPGYSPQRHLGGALYLFARGIDQPGQGVFFERPPHELIESLDQAFAAPVPAPVTHPPEQPA